MESEIPVSLIPKDEGIKELIQLLNREVFVPDSNQLNHLVADILVGDVSKEDYFKLVYLSAKSEKFARVAANAITVLNYARVSFSGMDLSEINIPGADLYRAILDHTILQGTILMNVRLQDSWLRGASLIDANLQGAKFNEHPYLKHKREINYITYSSDGQLLAVCAGYNIYLWDAKTNKLQYTLKGHTQKVNKVVFSHNNKILASCGSDTTIKLWNVDSGGELRTLKEHTESVDNLAFNLDDEILASGGHDKTVRVWKVESGELLNTFEEHTSNVNIVFFNLEGVLILASCNEDGPVELWDIKNDRLLQVLKGHTQRVDCIAVSADGLTIATGGHDYAVKLWNNRGELIPTLTEHKAQVYSVVFSPNGETLASGGLDNTVLLWSIKDGKVFDRLEGNRRSVSSIAYNNSGQILAFGVSDENIVRFWNIKTRQSLGRNNAHIRGIKCLAFDPDNLKLISSSDVTLRLWESKNGRTLNVLKEQREIIEITFDQDGQMVVLGEADENALIVWKESNQEILGRVTRDDIRVCSAAFSPDCKMVAIGGWDDTVTLWEIKSGKIFGPFKEHKKSTGIRSITFSSDGKLFASGGDDRTVCVWEVETCKKRCTFQGYHGEKSLAFIAGRFLAVGSVASGTGVVNIWEINTQELFCQLKGPVKTDRICGIAINSDGSLLACGNGNCTIWIWNIHTGEFLAELGGYWALVKNLAWNKQDLLATGSEDHAVKCWQAVRVPGQAIHFELLWTTHTVMYAEGCQLNAAKLSDLNAMFLHQHGGVGNPALIEEEVERIGDDKDEYDLDDEELSDDESSLLVLEKAIKENDLDTLQKLLDAGFNFNDFTDANDYEDGEPRHITKATALHKAAAAGNINIVDWLLNHGADPQLTDYLGHETPAEWARQNGHEHVATFIEKSASTFIQKKKNPRNLKYKHPGKEEGTWLVMSESDIKTTGVKSVLNQLALASSPGLESTLTSKPIKKTRLGDMSGRLLNSSKKTMDENNEFLKCLACSPDGKWIAVGIGNYIYIRESSDGNIKFTLNDHEDKINCLAFSPNNQILASGSNDGVIKLWSLPKFELKVTLVGHKKAILAISINQLSTLLASSSLDNTIIFWRIHYNNLGCVIDKYATNVTALCFSPTENLIVSGDRDGNLCIWIGAIVLGSSDIDPMRHVEFAGIQFTCATFSSDGRIIAVGTKDGKIILWDFNAEEEDEKLLVIEAENEPINCLRFTYDNKALVYLKNGVIYFRLIEKGIYGRSFTQDTKSIVDIQFKSGNILVSASKDGKIHESEFKIEHLGKRFDDTNSEEKFFMEGKTKENLEEGNIKEDGKSDAMDIDAPSLPPSTSSDLRVREEHKDPLTDLFKGILNPEFALNKALKKYKLLDGSSFNLTQGLIKAAWNNDVDDIEIFLRAGCNINERDRNPKFRRTALHWAVVKGSKAAIEKLLEKGAGKDIPDASGKTPLDYAKESDDMDIRTLFITGTIKRVAPY
jgi:WD40 repeat protein